jgi:hypothetical protein
MSAQPYAGLLERLGDIQDIIAAAEMQFAQTDEHHTYYADRHKVVGDAAEAISSLLNENVELRQIIADCAKAIGNGSAIHPSCAVEFMKLVPPEIVLHTALLRRIAALNSDASTQTVGGE